MMTTATTASVPSTLMTPIHKKRYRIKKSTDTTINILASIMSDYSDTVRGIVEKRHESVFQRLCWETRNEKNAA